MSTAAYASAPLSMASLRLRRLPGHGKPQPEAMNLGVDKTSLWENLSWFGKHVNWARASDASFVSKSFR